ncbi:hypothetical protein StoSoilA2_21330 [Arthrobacter sp. StoSoilA2]|nr:hypothetical protein StoSoilA2_21330 [Arthrobacter sp. StoSoilA2]
MPSLVLGMETQVQIGQNLAQRLEGPLILTQPLRRSGGKAQAAQVRPPPAVKERYCQGSNCLQMEGFLPGVPYGGDGLQSPRFCCCSEHNLSFDPGPFVTLADREGVPVSVVAGLVADVPEPGSHDRLAVTLARPGPPVLDRQDFYKGRSLLEHGFWFGGAKVGDRDGAVRGGLQDQ